MTLEQVRTIQTPTIICVGTTDPIAGDGARLAAAMPNAVSFDIVGRDHNLAVGDKTHRAAVIQFLENHLKHSGKQLVGGSS